MFDLLEDMINHPNLVVYYSCPMYHESGWPFGFSSGFSKVIQGAITTGRIRIIEEDHNHYVIDENSKMTIRVDPTAETTEYNKNLSENGTPLYRYKLELEASYRKHIEEEKLSKKIADRINISSGPVFNNSGSFGTVYQSAGNMTVNHNEKFKEFIIKVREIAKTQSIPDPIELSLKFFEDGNGPEKSKLKTIVDWLATLITVKEGVQFGVELYNEGQVMLSGM
jgi:hypothetical protein